jgi:HSP20 family molecular chaperone IbpA
VGPCKFDRSFFKDGSPVMHVDLPGVDPKDIKVSIAGNTLSVKGLAQAEVEAVGEF